MDKVKTGQMTSEEFLAYAEQHPNIKFDFMDGELVEVSAKFLPGSIRVHVGSLLSAYVKNNPIGRVSMGVLHELGGMKFIPDVALNTKAPNANGDFTDPPLVAVEIRSDTQSRASQRRKAESYIARGVPMVWLVMSGEQVEVYTQDGDEPVIYGEDDTLKGGDVLPGFEMSISELFAEAEWSDDV